jgi:hypothetical protein
MAKDNESVVIESESSEFGVGVVVTPNGDTGPPDGGGNYPCAVCISGGQTCTSSCSCACQGSTTSRPVKMLRKRIV